MVPSFLGWNSDYIKHNKSTQEAMDDGQSTEVIVYPINGTVIVVLRHVTNVTWGGYQCIISVHNIGA